MSFATHMTPTQVSIESRRGNLTPNVRSLQIAIDMLRNTSPMFDAASAEEALESLLKLENEVYSTLDRNLLCVDPTLLPRKYRNRVKKATGFIANPAFDHFFTIECTTCHFCPCGRTDIRTFNCQQLMSMLNGVSNHNCAAIKDDGDVYYGHEFVLKAIPHAPAAVVPALPTTTIYRGEPELSNFFGAATTAVPPQCPFWDNTDSLANSIQCDHGLTPEHHLAPPASLGNSSYDHAPSPAMSSYSSPTKVCVEVQDKYTHNPYAPLTFGYN